MEDFETELAHLVFLKLSISKRKKGNSKKETSVCQVCGISFDNPCLFYVHKLYYSPERSKLLRERVDKGLVVFDVPTQQILKLSGYMKQFFYEWVPFFKTILQSEDVATKPVSVEFWFNYPFAYIKFSHLRGTLSPTIEVLYPMAVLANCAPKTKLYFVPFIINL